MKKIVSFFYILKINYQKHILSNLIFLIILVLTIFSVSYYYGVNKSLNMQRILESKEIHTLTVYCSDAIISEDFLDSLIEDESYKIKNIMLYSTKVDKDAYFYCFSETGKSSYNGIYGDRISDINDSKFVTVIGKEYATISNKTIGDNIELAGLSFEIVGINDIYTNQIEIPISAFIQNGFVTEYLKIVLEDSQILEHYENLKQHIENNTDFNIRSVDIPDSVKEIEAKSSFNLLFAMFIFFLSAVNFSYMYRYILLKRRNIFATMRLVGISQWSYTVFLTVEMILSYLLCFVLAQFMNICFSNTMTFLSININSKLVFLDMFKLGSIMLLIILTGVILFASTVSKMNPILLFKESEGK